MKRAFIAGALLLLACGTRATERERPPDELALLGGEVAARVGGQAIPLSVVAAVANAQRVSPQEAARKVIDDEIAASAARARGLDRSWNLATAVRARITADRLLANAKRLGPPSNDEVERLSALHWTEVDRLSTVRVIHVIARAKERAQDAEAREVAKKLHDAVLPASSAEDFETRARAVPHSPAIEVKVETLPAFASDGRIVRGGQMDKAFAYAASALPAPGATSDVVESSFGWHVIRLIERLPEQRMPLDDRRTAFAEEALAMRGHDSATAVLKDVSARHPVEISPAAESLMQTVRIAGEQASNP